MVLLGENVRLVRHIKHLDKLKLGSEVENDLVKIKTNLYHMQLSERYNINFDLLSKEEQDDLIEIDNEARMNQILQEENKRVAQIEKDYLNGECSISGNYDYDYDVDDYDKE